MRCLVTGAAGFIAARVVDLLVQEGHEVTAVDNFNDAYDVRLKEWRAKHARVPVQKLDVADRDAVRALGHFDVVFNLAARAGIRQSAENPWVFIDTNVTGNAEYARAHAYEVRARIDVVLVWSCAQRSVSRNCEYGSRAHAIRRIEEGR